ncbi:unnamed protein product [Cunninghamella blakesleeana]
MKPKVSAVANLSEILYRYWRRSLLHDTFSISLPILEEVAFEEKFKYLIVTSPLLSDSLSIHTKQQKYHQTPPPFHTSSSHTRSGKIGTVVTLSGLFIALGVEKYLPSQIKRNTINHHHHHQYLFSFSPPTITMAIASGVSLYFIYRHMRRSTIRKLYQKALTQLQEVLEYSQLLDSKVHKALLTIQEIELVSRGYRLSTPLSPISRIEQKSKTKRCSQLRGQLAKLLRRAFIIYEEAIIDMTDSINKQSLSRLFDMYNIHSIASLSALNDQQQQHYPFFPDNNNNNNNNNSNEGNGITLDYLKTLAHLMHLKRRECMLQFLALSIMTSGHDSMRKDYESGWKNINSVLAKLVKETQGFANDVVSALESEFSKSINDIDNAVPTSNEINDTHFRQFVHRLSSLEQQLRTMEARLYLCHDELRNRQKLLSNKENHQQEENNNGHNNLVAEIDNNNNNNTDGNELKLQQELLKKEYLTMEKDLQQMVLEWESGKTALDHLFSSIDNQEQLQQQNEALPSPLPSPTMEGDSLDKQPPYLLTADETSELFNLPLPAKASVFEAIADVLEKKNTPIVKKSRAERIEEMKKKREQELKEKSSRLDSQTMVHELKNVLDRRIIDLDLSNEDEKK